MDSPEPRPRSCLSCWSSVLYPVLVPWLAPRESPLTSRLALRWWRTICLLSILPVAAAFHNVVLPASRSTCMLNPLHVTDWSLDMISLWLSQDPSLPLAMATMAIVYGVGLHVGLMRALVAPGFVCSLMYSLWVWDIPFTGRGICRTIHDNRVMLWEGQPLNSRVVILASAGLYLLALPAVLARFRWFAAPARNPVSVPDTAAALPAPAQAGRQAATAPDPAQAPVETPTEELADRGNPHRIDRRLNR